jgi:hypothetical protein
MKRWLILLGILLIAALWLRWQYVRAISLYVDEFTTLWAARQVQTHGLPMMPSGVLYTRGLLASYVEALFLSLFGFSYTVGRLPSLFFGAATIATLFWLGRREWRTVTVGWLAALGLTLLPEAIIWSSRARFYAQLQFFVLLTVWAAYRMSVQFGGADDQAKSQNSKFKIQNQWLFPLLFVLALFSQEETILLYPAIVLAGLWWNGWRFFLRRAVMAAHLICLLAMGIRFAIEILGQPGYFETIQAERPYVGWVFDLRGAWQVYGPLLVAPERLPWTVGGLWAVGLAMWALHKADWQPARLPSPHQATLYFALQFWWVVLVLFFFVGTTWRDARYLLLVQPFWLLVGAAGLCWGIERMSAITTSIVYQPRMAKVATTLVVTLLLIGVMTPGVTGVFAQQVEGYDRALGYLAEVRQPGDLILSPQPPACALVLGQCDYYAVQQGYEEYVIVRDGVLIDRWTGAPLLNRTEQLADLLQNNGRIWFVTDSLRLATRYTDDFVRTVIEQFDKVHEERGVMVLRADGWRTSPPITVQETLSPTIAFGPLALSDWERNKPQPGSDLLVTLLWQADAPVNQQINTSLRAVAPDGQLISQDDGPPARGLLPTTLIFATPRPDPKTLTLPADLPAGRYRLDVAAYAVETLMPLREPYAIDWFTVGPPPLPPDLPLAADWENGLQLVGMDEFPTTLRPGDVLALRLVWRTARPLPHDYSVFVHLVAADGQPLAQSDRAPEDGFYPTSAWAVDELVADEYHLAVPERIEPGAYRLIAGFYQPETNQRLHLVNGDDAFLLAEIRVQS